MGEDCWGREGEEEAGGVHFGCIRVVWCLVGESVKETVVS